MDKKHRERKKALRLEETDMLGSARMITITGQPELDEFAEMVSDKDEKGKKINRDKKRD